VLQWTISAFMRRAKDRKIVAVLFKSENLVTIPMSEFISTVSSVSSVSSSSAQFSCRPRVSVCLPVYNGANYLALAIESVLAQTFTDFELLIANDCSIDETQTIIEKYANRDTRIRHWINEKNLKLFGNYNACIDRATGQYIKLFAHDDILHPQMLEKMVAVLDEHAGVSLVTTARRWIDENGRDIDARSKMEAKIMKPFERDTRLTADQAIGDSLKDMTNWLGEPCAQMFRREQASGGYDTSFKQIGDLEYSYRLLQNGDYFFIADELCFFRRHAQSWSQARSLELAAHLDWFLLASRYKKYLPLTGMTDEQYCLKLLQGLTENFEYELDEARRLTPDQVDGVLKELLGADFSTYFATEQGGLRNLSRELEGVGIIAFVHCALLEKKLRMKKHEHRHELTDVNTRAQSMNDAMQNDIEALQRALVAKDEELDQLRQALTEMGNSVSWKVTAPLRKLKENLKN
jgi:glycosyltransferase involved in cell wall biosynthesis